MCAGPGACRLAGGPTRPRRPLLRLATGAATAGIAYRAGQRRAEQDAYSQQAAAAHEVTQPPPPPAPAPAAVPAPDTIAELERLARLHESGALTDQEFAAAKARALGI
jgi:Short C-terminal domain